MTFAQGDDVYLTEAVQDHAGATLTPEGTGRGSIVGLMGLDVAVVVWGAPGDYTYATVPFTKLRKYDRSRK